MSYTVASPGGSARPATVTAASALLYLCAAMEVVAVIVSVLAITKISAVLSQEFADKSQSGQVAAGMKIGLFVGVAFAVLFAIGFVVLGALLGKRKNPARIVTWVVAAIAVLCYGCSLGGAALSSSLSGLGGNGNAESTAVQQRLTESIPGWQTAVSTAINVIMLLALVAVIILLALPASNDFFRKEQEVWVPPTWQGEGGLPPMPPQAGPHYPGGPPAPGDPPAPGGPPVPPQG